MVTIENENKNVMVVAYCNDTDEVVSKNGEKTITLLFKTYSSSESDLKNINQNYKESVVVLQSELFLESGKLVVCSGNRERNELGEFCYRDNRVSEEHVKKAIDALKYAFLDKITDDKTIVTKTFDEVISNECEVFYYDCEFELEAEEKLDKLFDKYNISFKSLKSLTESKEFIDEVKGWTYWKTTGDKKKPAFD